MSALLGAMEAASSIYGQPSSTIPLSASSVARPMRVSGYVGLIARLLLSACSASSTLSCILRVGRQNSQGISRQFQGSIKIFSRQFQGSFKEKF